MYGHCNLHSYLAADLDFGVHAGSPPKNLGLKWATHWVLDGLSNPAIGSSIKNVVLQSAAMHPASKDFQPLLLQRSAEDILLGKQLFGPRGPISERDAGAFTTMTSSSRQRTSILRSGAVYDDVGPDIVLYLRSDIWFFNKLRVQEIEQAMKAPTTL